MANLTGPTHAEVRDRLLGEGSTELREEYARLRLRRAAMAAVEPSSNPATAGTLNGSQWE